MILGIDVGNSNIVAALIDEQGVFKEKRYETDRKSNNLYHEEHLRRLVESKNISGIIISPVVSEINEQLKQAIINMLGKVPIFVNAELEIGITIKYDNPSKLGADLITVAVGAIAKYNRYVYA